MFPDIGLWLKQLAVYAVPMLMAVTFHEVAHGCVAYLLGDPTAKQAGRLTLNPLKHLDVMGTLAFVLTRMIGWAKPVPVDARYFRNPRQGMMLVSIAGPVANFTVAALSVLFLHLLVYALESGWVSPAVHKSVLVPLAYMGEASVRINLALGVFNLLPIPPLDGSHILMGLLPRHLAYGMARLEKWGFLLIMLLAISGVLGRFLFPVVEYLYNIILL